MIETKSHQSVKSINSGYLTKDRWFCVRVRLLPVNGSRLVRDQWARTHPMFGTLNHMYGTPNTSHTKPWYIHHMYCMVHWLVYMVYQTHPIPNHGHPGYQTMHALLFAGQICQHNRQWLDSFIFYDHIRWWTTKYKIVLYTFWKSQIQKNLFSKFNLCLTYKPRGSLALWDIRSRTGCCKSEKVVQFCLSGNNPVPPPLRRCRSPWRGGCGRRWRWRSGPSCRTCCII